MSIEIKNVMFLGFTPEYVAAFLNTISNSRYAKLLEIAVPNRKIRIDFINYHRELTILSASSYNVYRESEVNKSDPFVLRIYKEANCAKFIWRPDVNSFTPESYNSMRRGEETMKALGREYVLIVNGHTLGRAENILVQETSLVTDVFVIR